MWETIKENLFDLNAIGAFSFLSFHFILIDIYGVIQVQELIPIIRYIETIWCIGSVIWGIERFISDIARGKFRKG